MTEVIAQHTALTPGDAQWLGHLTDEWDLLADLSFSDLILWVPDVDDNVFWAAAQIRPTTGPTALEDDVVGEDISYDPEHLVTEAYLSLQICATSGNQLQAGIPVDVHTIPVLRGGRCIGVVEMHTNRMGVRAPGALEDTYLETAEVLRGMVWRGQFPMLGEKPVPWISPRVGDGSVRVRPSGTITFASPNAVSAFRRLGWVGDLVGEHFPSVMASLDRANQPVEEPSALVWQARRPQETEVETESCIVHFRLQPLICDEGPCGWFVMCRDSTELRTRERQLITKDATIREIHHRVKNNLQTVAALLRLQARRTTSEEAANALNDAQKRVGAIAVVHEILSQAFDASVRFDDVADRLMTMVRDVATSHKRVEMRRVGSFGDVPAEVATNLSLVFTEICQNAIEHGLGTGEGHVVVRPAQEDGRLILDVVNDGEPLPDDFTLEGSKSLGLSIVTTLVTDMGGTFEMASLGEGFGTRARLVIPLRGSAAGNPGATTG